MFRAPLPTVSVRAWAPPLGTQTEVGQTCHGEPHTGKDRLTSSASILPEVTNEYDSVFPGVPHQLVVIEKVRHGQFFGVSGGMPLYSREALSDADLGALLAFLGL